MAFWSCLLMHSMVVYGQVDSMTLEEKIQLEYQKRIVKSHINGVFIPPDYSSALELLDEIIEPKGKMKYSEQPEDYAVNNVFFSFGRWLLINWGIEEGSRLTVSLNKLGLTFPDDMVRAIMVGYHRKLNRRPVDIEKIVEEVVEYRLQKTSESSESQ